MQSANLTRTMSGRSLNTLAETVNDRPEPRMVPPDPTSPVRPPSSRFSTGAISGLLTPKVPAMSPITPKSDFHAYAENSLSPLPSQSRSPSSRDWATYPVNGSSNFAADFVSTKKRLDEFSPAHLSFSTPSVACPAGGVFDDSCLDELLQPEGFVSIDNSSQTQLIWNSRALASRLQGSAEKDTIPLESLPTTDREAAGKRGGEQATKFAQRKRRKTTNAKTAEPINLEGAGSTGDASIAHTIQMLSGTTKTAMQLGFDQQMCYGQGNAYQGPFAESVPHSSDSLLFGGPPPAQKHMPPWTVGGVPRIQSPPQPTVYQGAMGSFLAAGVSPMAVRLHEAPNISPAITTLGARTVSCNCKKSRCLKLYCDCFRAQKYCDGCNCQQCANSPEHENDRLKSMASITERNPEAFKPRIACDSPITQIDDSSGLASAISGPGVQYHFSGCHCKKSACLKKYCECYQAQIPCQARCRCLDCKNTLSDGIFVGLSSGSGSPGCDLEYATLDMPKQLPNALVRGLVRATGARVLDPQPLPPAEREPLVKRENLIIREGCTDSTATKNMSLVQAGASGGITSRNLPVPNARLIGSGQNSLRDNSHISPISSDASPNGSVNSTWTSTTASGSSGPCFSNVSVDVLSAVLAARLRDAGSLIGAGSSPEACIREELLLMQQRGMFMNAPPEQGSFCSEVAPFCAPTDNI